MNDDSADVNAGFLVHLSSHSLLDTLSRLRKPSKRRIPVWRPAPLTSEKDLVARVVHDGHDDGRIGAREADVGNSSTRGAGRTFRGIDGCGVGGGQGCCGFTGEICGRTGAFESSVYGHGWLAALGAERVASVPVEELAGFGVDGG